MKYIVAFSSLMVINIGCAEKENDVFAPTEGDWVTNSIDVTTDTCGFASEEEENDAGIMTLSMIDASNFTLTEEEMIFECTLSGQDFTCADFLGAEDPTGGEMDVTLTATMSQTGSFSSASEGMVNLGYSANCEGADCDSTIEMMGEEMIIPCEVTGSADISLVEE